MDEIDTPHDMEAFQRQVFQLASCALDAKPRSYRSRLVEAVTNCVVGGEELEGDAEDDDGADGAEEGKEGDGDDFQEKCIAELGRGGLGIKAVGRCTSTHSYRRIANLLQTCILASLSKGKRENVQALCRTLCQLHCQSKDVSLLDETISSLSGGLALQTKPESTEDNAKTLYDIFVTVARKQCGNPSFPALSYASSLCADASSEIEGDLLEIFLQSASLSKNAASNASAFPPPSQLALSKSFLQSRLTQSSFDGLLAPTLGLKIRAHPESVLPLLEVILSSLAEGAVAAGDVEGGQQDQEDSSSPHKMAGLIDTSSQLTNEGGANLLPSTLKHLKSSKVEMRWLAWRTLILLAEVSGPSGQSSSFSSAVAVTESICDTLALTTGAMALNTADFRSGAYAALEGIAQIILEKLEKMPPTSDEDASTAKAVDRALSTLAASLAKDKKSSGASSASSRSKAASPSSSILEGMKPPTLSANEVGFNALLSWMRLSKKVSGAKNGSKKGGYDLALDYLAEPAIKYSPKDGEFRFRMGSLVVPPPSSYLDVTLMGGASSTRCSSGARGETFVESILIDLVQQKKIEKGLETIVDTAVKKHSTSDVVAQIDGALSIFLLVLSAHSSSLVSGVPPSATKVIVAGATKKGHETSFLYSPSMLETARTDVLVNYVLHRIIALYCKMASKASEDGGGKGKEEKPLVRIIERQQGKDLGATSALGPVSAATKALAICTANPLCPSATSSSPLSGTHTSQSSYPSIHSSLKTITTYSPATSHAGPAILLALFDQVNERSLQTRDSLAYLKEERAARELFEPIDESFNKLPIGPGDVAGGSCTIANHRGKLSGTASHSGYDPNSIRTAAHFLLPLIEKMKVNIKDATVEILCKALLLTHAGTTQRSNRKQRVALVGRSLDALKETVLPVIDSNGGGLEDWAELLAEKIGLCATSSQFDFSRGKTKEGADSSSATTSEEKDKPQDKAAAPDTAAATAAASPSNFLSISPSVHEASLSLINTLGGIAGSFDSEFDDVEDEEKRPYALCSILCIQKLSKFMASCLKESLEEMEGMSAEDVGLFRSQKGVLFRADDGGTGGGGTSKDTGPVPASGKTTKSSSTKKAAARKKGGGFTSLEDEEWERQVKKDLERKKKKQQSASSNSSGSSSALTPEEQQLLQQQAVRRNELTRVLHSDHGDFVRTLCAIRCLSESDIEVGNASLPTLGGVVIGAVVSNCAPLRSSHGSGGFDNLQEESMATLTTLASCVYEIEEVHAPTLARALAISFQPGDEKGKTTEKEEAQAGDNGTKTSGKKPAKEKELIVSALPSPCAPAACTIFEMDEYNECLSGNSFVILFPVLRAALTGPRNIPGCDSALSVLERHCSLLAGDEADPVVQPLRKDMASTVLELLSHDRCQTFVSPTAYETLTRCYVTEEEDGSKSRPLTAPEFAPLLGDFGALGTENTRVATMETLAAIAEIHPKLVKNNPLIENRIWINCFEKKERVRDAARRAWLVVHGHEVVDGDVTAFPADAPSKMYAVPLLPLLSHDDTSIASAAAASFSYAMGMHPDTAERNIVKLCNTFLSSFPAPSEDEPAPSKPSIFPTPPAPAKSAPSIAAPAKKTAKKPIIDTGLKKKPKKTSNVSTSMAKITGAPPPRKTAATKKLIAQTVKKERTLDQTELMSQFASPATVKKSTGEEDSESKIAIRLGVLRAIASITTVTDPSAKVALSLSSLQVLLGFLTAFGLGDTNESVRNSSRNAARDIVAQYGNSDAVISFFLPLFELILTSGQVEETCFHPPLPVEKVPKTVMSSDFRKEGIVVSLGSIALHLKDDADAKKIDDIIDMLLNALKTPSEDVQSSVALCLSKLMKKGRTQERVEGLLDDLMKECIHGPSLASRRGAAYGISAIVKGSGIASLKKYDVVKRLEEACTSGSPSSKEGSLFAIELLSSRLGILFEPYVIVLLPALLKAFSDSNDHVRCAAEATVGLIMGNLSGHGVKLVMPAVLEAFDEPEWRTKQASIHMLGAMSHCAPKQLASCLPKVVPKLTEAFSDTHPKVKSSAMTALEEICKVIKNPEISSISSTLLKALTDPSSATIHALEALISTEFLHAIDSPSLSLIIPVVHRGLRDRAATTKRYAALISGNIVTMIDDGRNFMPYLPILLPDLKSTLLDPIPDVRSISAKSLGSLTRGLGESTFPDLRPWLIETLRSEAGSSVERSGAAQGLTEVLVAGGAQLTENVMVNEILPLQSHPKAGTREGILWVLTFLPSALGQAFSSLIDESLPALLSGLADDNETVRDVALRAGRVLVKSNGKAHKDKILPSLESGLHNEDYRIRVASLTLLGDLLSMLGGTRVVKGNADTQDDLRAAERAQAQIALVLGNETRKRVLSSLYLARSDMAAVVRQSAVQVWKTVVSVTPRTLREILSELVDQIVSALASGDPERTQVAGRCLGDIVQKLGDQVLPEIIPVLRDSLYRGDEHTRQGVCVGLAEVIDCSSKEQITKFLHILTKVVQDALCDENEQVRKMAASCFQSLYQVVGARTLDEVVPALLVAMEGNNEVAKSRALNGMTGILSVRSRELLPYVVPRLLKPPITISHADALGSISAATSETLHMHFSTIIPSLIIELSSFSDADKEDNTTKEREESIRACSRAVCHNVGTIGVNWLIGEIASKCTNDRESVRKEACWFYQIVIEERKDAADFYEQVPIILRELIQRLNDDSSVVLKSTNEALNALTKCVPAEELVNHLSYIKNLIASMVSDARYRKGGVGDGQFFLPGFNMPKGLDPLMPIYQRGILYGDATVRETAAAGLGELISITSNKFLAGPFLIKLTGPLLRIVGDRNPSAVKIAIVQTLGLILTKGGPALRAFVPQFQTTFIKALSDPSRQVRIEAIKALALLMPLSTRVDPLIKELVTSSLGKGSNVSSETAGIVAVQTATLEALAVVLKHGGGKAKIAESIPSSLEAGKELVFHEDDGVRESAAKVIGCACELIGVESSNNILQEFVLGKTTSLSNCSVEVKHGVACICRRVLETSTGIEVDTNVSQKVQPLLLQLMKDEKTIVREAACVAIGAIIGSSSDVKATLSSVEKNLAKCMDSKEEIEVQKAVARGLCIAARMKPGLFTSQDGLFLMNNALKMAMSGAQRVQFSYNDFLWIALDVESGKSGLDDYLSLAHFDSAKPMKTLYDKVLIKIKGVADD